MHWKHPGEQGDLCVCTNTCSEAGLHTQHHCRAAVPGSETEPGAAGISPFVIPRSLKKEAEQAAGSLHTDSASL